MHSPVACETKKYRKNEIKQQRNIINKEEKKEPHVQRTQEEPTSERLK